MKKRNIIITLVLLLMPLMMGAQALKGSYFMENSINRNKMNPAFAPRANYFQLPVLGNIGVGAYTNLDLETFLYPSESGKLMTALHPNVTVEQFDKALAKYPHLDMDLSTNILSFGFYTERLSFWTVDLGVKVNMDTDLPRDLFTFLKKGTGMEGENSYNIANLNLYANAAVQASVGYSKDMSFLLEGLRIGAKARFIAPLAYAGVNLENVRLTTSPDKWTIQTEGYVDLAMQGAEVNVQDIEPGEDIEMPAPEFGFDLNKMLANKVIAGVGYSFDFGFEYKLSIGSMFDGISVSAAVTDLGQMIYKESAMSSYESNGKYEWAGIDNINIDQDFEGLPDDLKNDIQSLANLKKTKSSKLSRSTMPSFYAGVEVPFLWRKMSVGLLYSARKSHSYTRQELTASYNLKPCKWFALGANYSFLNTTKTLGFLLELTPKIGPALHLGTDYIFWELAEAPFMEGIGYLPTAYRLNFHFGLAFNLGSKYLN